MSASSPAPTDRFGNKRKQLTKVSLGAEDSVAWEKVSDIGKLIKKLKAGGFKIYAIEQDKKSIPLRQTQGKKIGLIVGNEVRGLSKQILNHADQILEIPMRGKKESLNVAVAFGIAAYHFINITPPLPSPFHLRQGYGGSSTRGGKKRKVI